MRTITGAVLASLGRWWKELIVVGVCVLAGFTPSGPGGGVALFAALGIGWLIGFFHRHAPFFQVIRGMDAKLDRALDEV